MLQLAYLLKTNHWVSLHFRLLREKLSHSLLNMKPVWAPHPGSCESVCPVKERIRVNLVHLLHFGRYFSVKIAKVKRHQFQAAAGMRTRDSVKPQPSPDAHTLSYFTGHHFSAGRIPHTVTFALVFTGLPVWQDSGQQRGTHTHTHTTPQTTLICPGFSQWWHPEDISSMFFSAMLNPQDFLNVKKKSFYLSELRAILFPHFNFSLDEKEKLLTVY